jgi:hypothetical protein
MTTTSVTKDAFYISLAVLLLSGVVAALDGGLWGYGWIVGVRLLHKSALWTKRPTDEIRLLPLNASALAC